MDSGIARIQFKKEAQGLPYIEYDVLNKARTEVRLYSIRTYMKMSVCMSYEELITCYMVASSEKVPSSMRKCADSHHSAYAQGIIRIFAVY